MLLWTWALQAVLSAAAAAAVCGAAYAIRHPPKVSVLYAGAIAALFGVVLLVARAILLEREFSVRPLTSRPSAAPLLGSAALPSCLWQRFIPKSPCIANEPSEGQWRDTWRNHLQLSADGL